MILAWEHGHLSDVGDHITYSLVLLISKRYFRFYNLFQDVLVDIVSTILCCLQHDWQATDISVLASPVIQPYLPPSFSWRLNRGERHFSFELCLPSPFQFSISPAWVLGKLRELCRSLVILYNCYLPVISLFCDGFTPDTLVFHLDKSDISRVPLPSLGALQRPRGLCSGSQAGCNAAPLPRSSS